jgi:ABC-2 type transport system ATP-binding protein
MIEARDLVKRYGTVEAIRGVSFDVQTGEIVGLLGPNGAGKTTIMKILTCFHFPTSGTAKVDSHDVITETIAARKSVGYLPENAPVDRNLKVTEYLDFVAQVRGYARKERQRRIDRSMTLCGLTEMAYRTIDNLSKGYRQRVGLAQAILHDPQTLILDEPTSGLDPNQIVEIRDLVREIGTERTVILSTHVLQEVENLCKNVLILNQGLIVAQGTTSELNRAVSGHRKVLDIVLEKVPAEKLESALGELPAGSSSTASVDSRDGRVRIEISLADSQSEGSIFDWAVSHGFTIVGMTNKTMDLEEIFHRLTQPNQASS